jgi:thioredoxin-related protein
MRRLSAAVLLLMLLSPLQGAEDSAAQFIEFDDNPLSQDIVLPSWFKLSFLELNQDIAELKENQKRGLIVYFGRKDCPYCKTHLEKNWGDRGIKVYTQKYFDVIAIDVQGQRPVLDTKAKSYKTEKQFSAYLKTHFTPSLVFYDEKGDEIMRLSGYHPPYQFRAVLEYVADKHYKKETLQRYLDRGYVPQGYEESELHENELFLKPPYALQRGRFPADSELVVFFEQPTCHACDVLHAGPLKETGIVEQLTQLEVLQLDMHSDEPVITPQGKRLSARQWAGELGLYYAPTIIFFDKVGEEILRIDSVVRFFRLNNVLQYILSQGYKEEKTYQLWRQRYKR